MAFIFPNPALEQTVTNPETGITYTWLEDPGKWIIQVTGEIANDGLELIWEGDTPPDPIGTYKLWYSTDTLELYFYFEDINGNAAWVPTSAPITMLESLEADVALALNKAGVAEAAANANVNTIALLDQALTTVENSLGQVTLQEVLDNGATADKGAVFGDKVQAEPGTENKDLITYNQLDAVDQKVDALDQKVDAIAPTLDDVLGNGGTSNKNVETGALVVNSPHSTLQPFILKGKSAISGSVNTNVFYLYNASADKASELRYSGLIDHDRSITTKEYVDNAVAAVQGGTGGLFEPSLWTLDSNLDRDAVTKGMFCFDGGDFYMSTSTANNNTWVPAAAGGRTTNAWVTIYSTAGKLMHTFEVNKIYFKEKYGKKYITEFEWTWDYGSSTMVNGEQYKIIVPGFLT